MTDEFDVKEENNQDQKGDSGEDKASLDKDDTVDDFLKSLDEIIDDSENNSDEKFDSVINSESEPESNSGDNIEDLDDLDISGNEMHDKDGTQKADSGEDKAKLDKDDTADDLLKSLDEIIDDSENNADEEFDSVIKPESESNSGDDIESLDDLDVSGNVIDDKDGIQKADPVEDKVNPDKDDIAEELLKAIDDIKDVPENIADEKSGSVINFESEPDSGDDIENLDDKAGIQKADPGEDKAKLDKDDIAEELLKAIDDIKDVPENIADVKSNSIIKPEPDAGDDLEDLEDLDLSGNELDDKSTAQKADLDKDGMPEDIFLEDKATLDNEGMPEGSITGDKAQLDTEGLPKTEKKKKKKKSSQDEAKQSEPDEESLKTFQQKIIARIKQFSLVKILIAASSLMAVLLFCMTILFFILFSDGDQGKNEEIFADNSTVASINEVDNASLLVNYEMKTFVIPMQDSSRDRVFFKSDFILSINKADLIQLKNNSVKIREAVYNQFHNKNSEIILIKLKRSEQLYKLKNVLNLIFKKGTIKSIEMVNYKLV